MDSIEEARRTIGPELVDATQLHAWAELRAAQDKFPELIRRLLDATPGITNVSVRTAEGVALQGWDGRAESDGKGPLPEGALIIELGVGKQPKKQKADDDFEKRKAELGSGATDYVFVFVTARRWGNGATWAATRREEQIFRNVVVLDADDVEGWLQRCPDVHHWLSELLGRRPHEAETLGRWWERFRRQTDPELPIELFGAGRQAEAARLAAQLRGDPAQVTVRTGWRDDALAFIHYVASQLSEQLEEPLTVASAQVWERAVRRPGHMTLVPLFDQPDIATALQQGHHVILIAAASEHVRGEKLELSRPQRDVAAEALRAAGIEFDKAYRLAGLARRSMPAMVRELARDGRIIDPPWADPPSVTVLAPAMLAGSWSVTASDTSALERLVGKDWTDIERVLSHWHGTHDAPFIRSGQSNWQLASPEEAYLILTPHLTTRDVETWRSVAKEVLLEIDPALDPSAEQRPMAGFLNVRRRYSAHLRSGVAQGLALLGSLEGEHLANGATGSDEASTVVRELLAKAGADESGRTWQSLSDVLPLIAEASPDEFLDAVRADLDRSNPLLATMFGDSENAHWFSTSSPHTGLLRALEGLAWSPRWILDASLALARLDAVDPGGRLANRPLDSLSSIFPHWIRHTSAPLETRIKAVELISRQVPETAWHLTHRILPTDHATSWPPHAPRFRDWKPESQSVSITEGLEYISAVVTVALELAGDHPDRWADLAEHLAALPPEDRERVLAFLERKAQVALPDADRLAAWDRLRAEIARHRRFPSAEWSMDEETLGRLEKVTAQLEPGNESARLSYLFGWHPDVPGVDQTDATYEAEVTRLRHDAVRTVLETEGFDGLISVSARASAPHLLGVTVADVAGQDVASEAIAWLDADDAKPRDVALAWAARSVDLRGLDWLLQTLETPEASTSERKLGLLLAAPPGQPLWDVIEVRHSDLLDAYWRRMSPWRVDRADVERAAGELAFRERAWSAIDMLAMDLHQYKEGSESPAPDLVLEVVEKATETDPHESGLLIGQDAARP